MCVFCFGFVIVVLIGLVVCVSLGLFVFFMDFVWLGGQFVVWQEIDFVYCFFFGDSIDVVVYFVFELNCIVIIGLDGCVFLFLIGNVMVVNCIDFEIVNVIVDVYV